MTLPAPAHDRTCLVTGASSGIGVELARELAGRGHGITLVARRRERLEELAADIAESSLVRTEVIALDLTDADARAALPDQLAERGLTVDVLVNNAGFSTVGPVAASDHRREVAMVRTNVEAVSDLCSMFVPGMVERHRGAVLNVASTAAFQPMPGQAGYAASKAFVLSYTHALRAELAGSGVTVTALCPGPVDTEFIDTSGMDRAAATRALPSIMWVPAQTVASAAVEGLVAGRAVVIPGAANRATAVAAHLTPRTLLMPLLARRHPAARQH